MHPNSLSLSNLSSLSLLSLSVSLSLSHTHSPVPHLSRSLQIASTGLAVASGQARPAASRGPARRRRRGRPARRRRWWGRRPPPSSSLFTYPRWGPGQGRRSDAGEAPAPAGAAAPAGSRAGGRPGAPGRQQQPHGCCCCGFFEKGTQTGFGFWVYTRTRPVYTRI